MPKLAIMGTIEAVPGTRNQLLAALTAHKVRCLATEPGTLQFEVLVPHENETQVLLYELYEDDAAFETHINGPALTRFREETVLCFAGLQMVKCAPAA